MAAQRPSSARLRMYNVGFGDCFLLSFDYGASKRHLLVDFGSTSKPESKKALSTLDIAKDIQKESGGKLHAVVATHRHRDHISGFATSANKKGSGDIIAALSPDVVVQPWTEAPDAPKSATSPKLTSDEKGLTDGLEAAHIVAQRLFDEAERGSPAVLAAGQEQIRFLGDDNLKNMSAIRNLARMGAAHEYLAAGMKSKALPKLFPGVEFTVLGPATPKDYPDIAKQRAKNAKEYWLTQAHTRTMASSARAGSLGFARVPGTIPPRMRWIVREMDAAHGQQLLGIVRALDSAMNNTSLILLLKVGEKRLLFPGDAQGESWAYVLDASKDRAAHRAELAKVDFYKVGHHGSLNATPKTLWSGFERRKGKALKTAMSTKYGVHGDSEATRVPKGTLVDALKSESTLSTTIDLDHAGHSLDAAWVDIAIPL